MSEPPQKRAKPLPRVTLQQTVLPHPTQLPRDPLMVWEWIKRLHAERNLAVRKWQELRDDLAAHKKKMNELTATHAKKIKKMHVNEDAELKTPFFRAAGCCDSGDLFDDALRILEAGGIPGAKATARSRAKRIGMICNRAHDGKFAALLAKELTPSNLFPCSSLLYQIDMSPSGANYSVLEDIRKAQVGLKKYQIGYLPSSFGVKQCAYALQKKMSMYLGSEVVEGGTVWKCDPQKALDFMFERFGYYDLGTSEENPILIKATADGLQISNIEGCFIAGICHIDDRLPCFEGTGVINSKAEYFPLVAAFCDEKAGKPYTEVINQVLKKIENEGEFEGHTIWLKVACPADMKQQMLQCEHGGAARNSTFFCHLCTCTSSLISQGQAGGPCPFAAQLGCPAGCHHRQLATKAHLAQMRARLNELKAAVEPNMPLTSRPLWSDKESLQEECRKRNLGVTGTMQSLEERLLEHCGEGVHLEKYVCRQQVDNCVETAPTARLLDQLQQRNKTVPASKKRDREWLRDELRKLLLLEDELHQLEAESGCPIFNNLQSEVLVADVIKMVLCVLHAEMRMGEKLLNALFNLCLGRKDINKSQAEAAMDAAAAHLKSYSKIGAQWRWRYDKNNPTQLADIQMEKKRIRTIFALEHKDQALQLIKILLGEGHDKLHAMNQMMGAYLEAMAIMTSEGGEIGEERAVQFQQQADLVWKWMVLGDPESGHEAALGEEGITNYFHCLCAGHFYELMLEWGSLMRFRNEGVEALNLDIKVRYLKHSQRGGHKGSKASQHSAGKAESVGHWLERRLGWRSGVGEEMWPEAVPQCVRDEMAAGGDADAWD